MLQILCASSHLGANLQPGGGSIRLGDGRYQLRVPGEFETPEEIYSLVISTFEGRPVYLKDLARVIDSFKDETSRSRLNGRSAVNISVKKRVGENIIAITDKIDELIERRQHSWPQGTQITKLMDRAKDVRLMIADIANSLAQEVSDENDPQRICVVEAGTGIGKTVASRSWLSALKNSVVCISKTA